MTHDRTYTFDCRRERETDAAILVTHLESGEQLWFPLSTVHETHFHNSTHLGSLIVDEWIAKKKGLC